MSNGKFKKYDYFKGFEKFGYQDYHNHLGGVLPYDELKKFYLKNFIHSKKTFGYECSELRRYDNLSVLNFKEFKSGVGLFLRTTYHLLSQGYDFTTERIAPERGAHVAMLGVFYLFLFAAKADIIKEGVQPDVKPPKGPGDIKDVLMKYLGKCYELLSEVGAKKLPDDCGRVARRAFMNYVRATRYTPFDDGYVGRSAYLKIFSKDEGKKKEISVGKYGMESLEWLYKEEKTRYVEMSQPQKKIPEGSKEKAWDWCKWLLLTANHREILAGEKSFEKNYWIDLVKGLEVRRNFIGIDLAGPEGYSYKQRETETLVNDLLRLLQEAAKAREEKYKIPYVVFRPHAGEGSSILDKGASLVEVAPVAFVKGAMEYVRKEGKKKVKGMTSAFFKWLDGEYISSLSLKDHVRDFKIYKKKDLDSEVKKMSINNIQVFINALRKVNYPEKFPNVIVRFGHVTHVTEKQAQEMAELGIRADVNLGSNLRTGSLSFLEDLQDAQNRRAVFGDWNKDWASLVDRGHGIEHLLTAGVKVALGSDGQGVEVTSINTEYHLAEEYLKDLKIGKQISEDKFRNYGIALINNAREMIGPK
ncbi:MAG: hypothetical protein HF982_01890 [Desulfobacteraceae bacterium]|nr:hypothetical protein [Desulfobacteraceae bacterium]MBC2718345.1 hypothetical protein [Desulfobacteraceae bacterium]